MSVNNYKIETTLNKLLTKREQLAAVTDSIKEYMVIDSENLQDLNRAIKDLRAQVKAEREELIAQYREDGVLMNMKDKQIRLKGEVNDLTAEFRDLLVDMPMPHGMAAFQCTTETGKVQVQLEQLLKIYLNGKKFA